jgi:hypothetical protein
MMMYWKGGFNTTLGLKPLWITVYRKALPVRREA